MAHTFPGIRRNEYVRLCIHSHWIVHCQTVINVVLVGAVLLGISFVFGRLLGESDLLDWLHLFEALALMALWFWAFQNWIDDEFDSFILTNERLIEVEQVGLFKITVSETSLDLIQNTQGQSQGLLGSLFNIGDLQVQTAAKGILLIERVHKPGELAQIILEERERFMGRYDSGGHEAMMERPPTRKNPHMREAVKSTLSGLVDKW